MIDVKNGADGKTVWRVRGSCLTEKAVLSNADRLGGPFHDLPVPERDCPSLEDH